MGTIIMLWDARTAWGFTYFSSVVLGCRDKIVKVIQGVPSGVCGTGQRDKKMNYRAYIYKHAHYVASRPQDPLVFNSLLYE